MTARIIDGRAVAQPFVDRATRTLREAGIAPDLSLIVVESGAPLLDTNFRLHARFLERVGFVVREHRLPETSSEEEVLALIERLNGDDSCDAILVLVPPHVRVNSLFAAIDPAKEIEGLHPDHAARMLPVGTQPVERPMMVPTALRAMLDHIGVDLERAVIVEVVDLDLMRHNTIANLVARYGVMQVWPVGAALTIVDWAHPRLAEFCAAADVIAVSVTEPGVIRGEWIKPGATVLDFNAIVVGSRPHPTDPTRSVPVLRGGVRADEAAAVAAWLCTVPGGFGPVMLAVLAANAADAAVARRSALVPVGGVR